LKERGYKTDDGRTISELAVVEIEIEYAVPHA
jgi:hypothetical protein